MLVWNRCPFGCAAADNTSHLLSGCTQYHAAYVGRHDRVVRRIATMIGQLTPMPDELDLMVSGNLAAPVPVWVRDLVFEPIPATVPHTRPDIWFLNEGHLFLIEVAVAGDTLHRQTEIALAKRATYTPLPARTLQACSKLCVTEAVAILRMRQVYPTHGYANQPPAPPRGTIGSVWALHCWGLTFINTSLSSGDQLAINTYRGDAQAANLFHRLARLRVDLDRRWRHQVRRVPTAHRHNHEHPLPACRGYAGPPHRGVRAPCTTYPRFPQPGQRAVSSKTWSTSSSSSRPQRALLLAAISEFLVNITSNTYGRTASSLGVSSCLVHLSAGSAPSGHASGRPDRTLRTCRPHLAPVRQRVNASLFPHVSGVSW